MKSTDLITNPAYSFFPGNVYHSIIYDDVGEADTSIDDVGGATILIILTLVIFVVALVSIKRNIES